MDKKKQDHSKMDHSKMDHSAHHKMMIKDFKRRFIISGIITIPILILSPTVQEWVGFSITFLGLEIILLILSSIIYFYGGWPFLKGLFDELKKKLPGMMTLIAVAISIAYFYSIAIIFGLSGSPFFWELATLIDIMLLGHWIEMRSVLGASRALEKLVQLLPQEAHLIHNGEVRDVPLSDIQRGTRILIKPGEKIPSDGIIVEGSSYINESMLTGESVPSKKIEGDSVIGGSVNGDSSLEMTVEKTGEESYLSKVITLVRDAQAAKSKTQALVDKAAFVLTIISISVGLFTLGYWIFAGPDISFAIERMATVMVITCPHALGLAIPLVVAVSTAESAKNGLLIRNRTSFENSRKISTILFDKTGTLTEGQFGVGKVINLSPTYSESQMLSYAASLEQNSEHPIGQGILKYAHETDIPILQVFDFQAIKGKGVEGIIESKKFKIVSPGYLKELKINFPEDFSKAKNETIVFLVENDHDLLGMISLADQIRKESYDAIKKLKKMGIKCWMVTGDNEKTAKAVAEELHLDGYYAEVLPHEKLEKVKDLQKRGEFVAMTGDGINDAPALAQANVGIAIGSGTDVAAETADIILVNSNPKDIAALIKFGKATYNKMVQNLAWATGYNVFAIPLAAGALISIGILISPAIGAVFMSLSTVIVSINARLLKVDK
ncbi:copper-translocating P-type ATPase [Candidatus Lokiarchaeum ossiferum]|uniref:copper-translocating P-type ATPase n=1 Tax=Candidatus Lokiarchaeum ossiferum TaxID=2951803 RepID=UPI00352EBDF2